LPEHFSYELAHDAGRDGDPSWPRRKLCVQLPDVLVLAGHFHQAEYPGGKQVKIEPDFLTPCLPKSKQGFLLPE
jgi:hypothetical protein